MLDSNRSSIIIIMQTKSLVISIIVIIVLVAGGVWYYIYKGGIGAPRAEEEVEKEKFPQLEVGGEVSKATVKPMEKMPSVNPFEEVVNPFEGSYKNPFK